MLIKFRFLAATPSHATEIFFHFIESFDTSVPLRIALGLTGRLPSLRSMSPLFFVAVSCSRGFSLVPHGM